MMSWTLSLMACACSRSPGLPYSDTLAGIKTTGTLLETWEETTPVVWNGNLVFVHSKKLDGYGDSIKVIDANGTLLGTGPENFGFVSALVANGRLYVFGNTPWGKTWKDQNQIRMTSTTDLTTWTEPKVIKTAQAGQTFFNTSVTPSPDGYTLAYEVCEQGTVCFSFRFMQSADLENWQDVGQRFSQQYSACPTLRYVSGYYYAFYLAMANGQYFTLVSRSKNLKKWEQSPYAVLTPAAHAPGSINASDFDLVEYDGRLEMVFIDGNQTTTGKTRRAVYEGTLVDFTEALFR